MNNGIIHIGANGGQEADTYCNRGNNVIWIEASPFVMPTLLNRIAKYKNQKAIQALVTDKDGIEYDFLCDKNNAGQSSSLFDFHLHTKMFPKVVMGESIKLIGKTLPTILKENNINLEEYKHINMDVEGAELLVLKGAIDILNNFETITLEASDFEARKGQPLLKDVEEFMYSNNFTKTSKRKIHHADGVKVLNIDEGSFYEVTFTNTKYPKYRPFPITQKKTNSFIETGSYRGDSIKVAIELGFKEIFSIELHPEHYQHCVDRFSEQKNVKLFLGDSGIILSQILKDNPNTNFTFWLDGHFSGTHTARGEKASPLMEELENILSRKIENEIIYIDDMRIYKNHDSNLNEENILSMVKKYKPDANIFYIDTRQAKNDVLVIEY